MSFIQGTNHYEAVGSANAYLDYISSKIECDIYTNHPFYTIMRYP